jgi:ribosomal protein L11 methyltransferase
VPYRIDIDHAGRVLFDRLVELGAIDAELAGGDGIAALMPDTVTPEQISRALGVSNVAVSAAIGRDEDSVWILSQRPSQVGRLRLLPAHSDAGPNAIRLVDTTAFGTGLHPTTALCLEVLDEAVQHDPPDAVLDVGIGSGVLALAALVLGVPRATGLDTDDAALRVAAENARLNGMDGRLQLTRGGPDAVSGTWPLVLANVLAAPLIEMAPTLVRRISRRGVLVLSGIPASVEQNVDEAYQRLGMRHVRTVSRAGWVALVLRASW